MILLLTWFGCAYPEEQFVAELDDALCDWATRCLGEPEVSLETRGYCAQQSRVPDTECTYDEDNARECVDELEWMACARAADEVSLPAACDWVYRCE